jgi:ketosteroid isomerase-like protein
MMMLTSADVLLELGVDPRPDAELTHEEIIERNVRVVDLHFHSENPDDVEKAVALYTDDITWEAPARGVVMKDSQAVLEAYRKIFLTLAYRKTIALRRFATERFVFDDQVAFLKVIGEPTQMANFPYPMGTEVSVRLAHCFEMRDGRIAREIAYEIWRKVGNPNVNDDIPEGSPVETFPGLPD